MEEETAATATACQGTVQQFVQEMKTSITALINSPSYSLNDDMLQTLTGLHGQLEKLEQPLAEPMSTKLAPIMQNLLQLALPSQVQILAAQQGQSAGSILNKDLANLEAWCEKFSLLRQLWEAQVSGFS